jgi:hypothetical protein
VDLIPNDKGNYRFLTGSAPYSSGVLATTGYEIVHVSVRKPLLYRQGFEFIDRYLADEQRPIHALCAIELRTPKPFTFDGFAASNSGYQQLLVQRDLLVDGSNPIARTNVAPQNHPPQEPVLAGFSYSVPVKHSGGPPTFVIAGAGELIGQTLSPSAVVRRGEASPEAMREKAAYVMTEMRSRLNRLQMSWSLVTHIDVYTVHPFQTFLEPLILDEVGSVAVMFGVNWLYSRPPIADLDFEMDVRGTRENLWVG